MYNREIHFCIKKWIFLSLLKLQFRLCLGFPGSSVVKSLPASAGDVDLIPELGRSPGLGNGNLLQYSCLENSMDREAWWATGHEVTNCQTQLSMHGCVDKIFSMT